MQSLKTMKTSMGNQFESQLNASLLNKDLSNRQQTQSTEEDEFLKAVIGEKRESKKGSTNMLDAAIFRFEMDPQFVPAIGNDRKSTRTSRKEEESPEETKQSEVSTQYQRENPLKGEDHGPIVKIVNEAQFISMMEEKATSR